jgi:hypothetical protein
MSRAAERDAPARALLPVIAAQRHGALYGTAMLSKPPLSSAIVLPRCLPRRPARLSWALTAWRWGRLLSVM